MQKKIVFVSEVQDPYSKGSSTQILTENLLQGLKEGGYIVDFVAIYDDNYNNNINNMLRYYNKYVNNIILVNSRMNLCTIAYHKYRQLFRTIKGLLIYRQYIKVNIEIENDSTILLSHTPSLEAAFICKALLRKYKFKKYIQYWSDPYALSGIYLENLSIKRWPNIMIERAILKMADKIVYSGKPLFLAQKELYMRYSNKMYCVDFSYSTKKYEDANNNDRRLFGYVGNYFSSTRDIKPLFNAFSTIDYASLLVCGKGDVEPDNSNKIIIEKRKPQNEIAELEAKLDVFVCIINHSCYQIPGKIFYNTNSNKIILVILDGKYTDLFRKYLEQFNRFEFCDNNVESITKAVDRICRGECSVDLSGIDKLSPQNIIESILE